GRDETVDLRGDGSREVEPVVVGDGVLLRVVLSPKLRRADGHRNVHGLDPQAWLPRARSAGMAPSGWRPPRSRTPACFPGGRQTGSRPGGSPWTLAEAVPSRAPSGPAPPPGSPPSAPASPRVSGPRGRRWRPDRQGVIP